jgi:hypothetical protein
MSMRPSCRRRRPGYGSAPRRQRAGILANVTTGGERAHDPRVIFRSAKLRSTARVDLMKRPRRSGFLPISDRF